MSHTIPVVDRLLRHIEIDPIEGCWHWTAKLDRDGYGHITIGGRGGAAKRVHRVAYELWTGEIPPDLQVDHMCHTQSCRVVGRLCPHRRCFNPDHLQLLTTAENTRRSAGGRGSRPWGGRPRLDETCGNGHPRTEASTLMHLRKDGYLVRVCRICRDARYAAWVEKQKSSPSPTRR